MKNKRKSCAISHPQPFLSNLPLIMRTFFALILFLLVYVQEAHSDGMVSWIDENTISFNVY